MRFFYLCLAVLGVVLPFGALIPWLVTNGLDLTLLYQQAFSHQISAFAWLDVIVAAVALIGFILVDGKKHNVRGRLYAVIGTLCVGVSFGLPLYLLLREKGNNSGF